jgi:hypothetical protein
MTHHGSMQGKLSIEHNLDFPALRHVVAHNDHSHFERMKLGSMLISLFQSSGVFDFDIRPFIRRTRPLASHKKIVKVQINSQLLSNNEDKL